MALSAVYSLHRSSLDYTDYSLYKHVYFIEPSRLFFNKQDAAQGAYKIPNSNVFVVLSSASSPPIIPRAAVSVCVRCILPDDNDTTAYYLLVQRGNEPSKGMWSLPGGKRDRS
jgi:hypothetical protein